MDEVESEVIILCFSRGADLWEDSIFMYNVRLRVKICKGDLLSMFHGMKRAYHCNYLEWREYLS